MVKRTCILPDCDRRHFGLGYCQRHYLRLHKYGDPLWAPPTPMERFRSHVEASDLDGCHVWTAGRDRDGYGNFKVNGRMWRAHRWIFEQAHGPVGDLMVCHRCDNRPCVRLDHLFVGDAADNSHDMVSKGRHVHGDDHWTRADADPIRGEGNPAAVLTEDQVRAIRATYRRGRVRQVDLADQFGVSQPLISAIIRRAVWAHLKE